MKWYAVDKYKPLFDVYYFVTNGDAIWIAKYTDDLDWLCDNGDGLSWITHFCIPDPVEIEE